MNGGFLQRSLFSYIKETLFLSLPMAGARFIQMLSNFIGMMFLAKLGKKVLAASTLISATFSVIFLFFISILFAVSFVASQYFGAKKNHEIGRLFQQSLLLSVLLGIVMSIVLYFINDILLFFHQPPELIAYACQYFHAISFGAIPILINVCCQQLCYGILRQRAVLVINFFILFCSVFLSYSLIFGRFGLPQCGVAGLGYALIIQSIIGIIVVTGYLFFSPARQSFALFSRHSHQGFSDFMQVCRVGWPMSLQFGGELLSIFVIALMIGWLGVGALAAVQVTQQWMLLVIVPVFAMSEAGGILVGHAVGRGAYDTLFDIGRANLVVSVGFVLIIGIAFFLFPDFFASFYFDVTKVENSAMLYTVRVLFLLLVFTLILNTIRDVVSGLLRGLFDTKFPMHAGLTVMWLLVLPIGYLFAFPFKMGVIGFRFGGLIGLLAGAITMLWRWRVKVKAANIESHFH